MLSVGCVCVIAKEGGGGRGASLFTQAGLAMREQGGGVALTHVVTTLVATM